MLPRDGAVYLGCYAMEDELRQFIKESTDGDASEALEEEREAAFCLRYGLEKHEFENAFARWVAIDFAMGELSYSQADTAMNWLSVRARPALSNLPLEIYLAFDAGEYTHPGEMATIIPWQKYTLPYVMKIFEREGWLPRTC